MSTAAVLDYSKLKAEDAFKLNGDDLRGYLRWMASENDRLTAEKVEMEKRAAEQGTFGIKIGRSGTVSVTGFGRYGVSLYTPQWLALIPLIPAIGRFIKAYSALIEERVANPLSDNLPNEFKPLKLKADSEFKAPSAA